MNGEAEYGVAYAPLATPSQTSEHSISTTFEKEDALRRGTIDKTHTVDPISPERIEYEKGDVGNATWDDFIGNTTFHGCRFVFADSQGKMRK